MKGCASHADIGHVTTASPEKDLCVPEGEPSTLHRSSEQASVEGGGVNTRVSGS